MKFKMFSRLCILGCVLLFTACGMMENAKKLTAKSETFVNALSHHQIDKALGMIELLKGADTAYMRDYLDSTSQYLNRHYGKDMKMQFTSYSSQFGTGSASRIQLVLVLSKGNVTGKMQFFFTKDGKIKEFHHSEDEE